jgi:hypothetical protein
MPVSIPKLAIAITNTKNNIDNVIISVNMLYLLSL